MILLDSSVLVAYFNEDDALHERGLETLKRIDEAGEKAVVSVPVIFETASALKWLGAKRENIANFCEKLLKTYDTYSPPAHLVERSAARYRKEGGLSLVDCFLLETSAELHAEVATFDEKLSKTLKK